MTALITDLKRRGLLEDTLVIWSGEFGRTPMKENRGGTNERKFVGRDHNPGAFYRMDGRRWRKARNILRGNRRSRLQSSDQSRSPRGFPCHHAPSSGIRAQEAECTFQGLDQRLTGIKDASVIKDLIA